MEKSNNQNPSNEIQLHEKQHLSDEQDGKNYETTYILGDLQDGKKAIKAQEGDAGEERETWGKKIDFILSVVGFSVDLANIWRFPYLCYSNGGGAFLIPYTMMLLAGGIPLFYMELALGQFNKAGAITCWGALCPLFKGTGWAVVLIAFYTDFFYNVIIAWCLHFFFSSFQADLPWTTCGNDWNTEHCFDGTERVSKNTTVTDGSNSSRTTIGLSKILSTVSPLINNSSANATTVIAAVSSNKSLVKSSAQEYFERGMLQSHESSGFLDFGMLNWQLVLCLLGVFLICYFSMWKGILVSGKVVWFTALFPYCVLLILMVKGATLPGAGVGVKYYLTPNITKLGEAKVWVEAANQVFFSLGPGFGVLLAFSSYNPIHNNVYRDALMTSVINCATSFFSGFIIFMVLGYMAERTNQPIDKVATHGPGLVFIVYPEAIATLPGASFWAVIFFLMLLTMGLDSSFGGSEAIITALSDEFPILRKKRELFVGCLFSVYFIIGLTICSQGGIYIFQLMEKFAAGYSILFAVFFETLAMSWCYGVDLFCSDIEVMIGHRPGRYWPICWKYVAPLFLMFIIVFGLVNFEPLNYEGYKYPLSGNMIGWTIALSSILCIPGFAIYGLLTTRGTLMERLNILITPTNNREEKIRRALQTVTINGDISCAVDV